MNSSRWERLCWLSRSENESVKSKYSFIAHTKNHRKLHAFMWRSETFRTSSRQLASRCKHMNSSRWERLCWLSRSENEIVKSKSSFIVHVAKFGAVSIAPEGGSERFRTSSDPFQKLQNTIVFCSFQRRDVAE